MRKIGINMQSLADHLERGIPISVDDAANYMRSGPQYALDTLERLCDRGIARHFGSGKFIKNEEFAG